MPTVVHFGAGKVGRGFLGQLYAQAGWKIVFLDVVPSVVAALNARQGYTIEIVSDESVTPFAVEQASALRLGSDEEEEAPWDSIRDVAVAASLMSVSVGVRNLPRIAEPLARMLQARVEQRGLDDAAVDIVVLENQLGAAEVLRDAVLCRRRAYPEAARLVEARRVGFVGTVVGRMIPVVPDERLAEDPLLVRVEPFCTLPVERPAFTTGVPDIPGFEPVDNIDAYEERKLFTHNCSHSSAAYLGYLAGHTFVWQVMRDPALRDKVEGIMREIGAGLIARHRFDPQALREHEDDLLHRFANRALGDTVARVGGDPVRKLGPHDRMIGGARCALDGGGDAQGVCEAIAAALKFNPPGDPSAPQIRKHLEQGGPEAVWRNVCGLSPDDPLWDRLMAAAEA